MDENSSLIYGLELQARAMTPQLAESNEIRFFIATHSLKPNNQIHLIEYNEEKQSLKAVIFSHPLGEIWKLNSSPHNSRRIATCFSSIKNGQVLSQTAILDLPEDLQKKPDQDEFLNFHNVEILPSADYGNEIKNTEFHPSDEQIIASVIDGKIIIYNRSESKTRIAAEINANKHAQKFTTGKWSQHHQGNQFITLHECSVKSFDIRDTNHCAWSIEEAHGTLVRDLDSNPNKSCHLATAGDDGYIKIWDTRMTKEPIFFRNDHYHWIWSVRFNTFHDQLLLTSSSDGKVLLTCAGSVSSETQDNIDESLLQRDINLEQNETKKVMPDGLLQTFDQHEDSVYCAEWSSVDPWIFASLSYDGRMIISKVPKQYKYQILF
ncbi:EARP-interacting protein homolog [Condylostylus longicornis]|uniref:EARP-interacting protein homolog n=1 Tax=Condylostylus longicornis TaxID=2530218 RepID=UPI00244DDB17|nr:EARP-interacting protein homolog [Condylostylus longicornis]